MRRILVVSLMKMGDAYFHDVIFRSLRLQYPNYDFDVLLSDEASRAPGIFESANKIVFPYKKIQKFLVEQNYNIHCAYKNIRLILDDLNSRKYEIIYNLSHTKLSAKICAEVGARRKLGAVEGSRSNLFSYQYLNKIYSFGSTRALHFSEAISLSVGTPLLIKQTEESSVRHSEKVLVQMLSSDIRKNLPLSLVTKIVNQHKQNVSLMFAPFEIDKARSELPEELHALIREVPIESIEKEVQAADLVISADTFVLHLAAQMQKDIIAYYLGPANAFRTYPLRPGAQLFWSNSACAPCSHVGVCHQSQYLCKQEISQSGNVESHECILFLKPLMFGSDAFDLAIVKLAHYSFYLGHEKLYKVLNSLLRSSSENSIRRSTEGLYNRMNRFEMAFKKSRHWAKRGNLNSALEEAHAILKTDSLSSEFGGSHLVFEDCGDFLGHLELCLVLIMQIKNVLSLLRGEKSSERRVKISTQIGLT